MSGINGVEFQKLFENFIYCSLHLQLYLNFTLEQAMNAQSGSRNVAPLLYPGDGQFPEYSRGVKCPSGGPNRMRVGSTNYEKFNQIRRGWFIIYIWMVLNTHVGLAVVVWTSQEMG
jgi:hypothetical protein